MSQALPSSMTIVSVPRVPGPGTVWQRLCQGVCRSYARPDWSAINGTDWADTIMQAGVTDDFHEKQGRSTGRLVLEAGGKRLVVYLKRHYRLSWWRGWSAAFWPAGNFSPAMQERQNLEWAHEHGLPVPKIVAAGEWVGPLGKLQSFLAIEELADMLPLHQAIPLAARRLEPRAFRMWKAGLAREMARLARLLHDQSAFHKDFYFCHFFIARADIVKVPVVWTNRVFMIDFHRFARHSLTRLFWITKDLGQLLFSSEVEGIDARDRVRFWHAYWGGERRSWLAGWIGRIVRMRGRRYREHNAKKALQRARAR